MRPRGIDVYSDSASQVESTWKHVEGSLSTRCVQGYLTSPV